MTFRNRPPSGSSNKKRTKTINRKFVSKIPDSSMSKVERQISDNLPSLVDIFLFDCLTR